MAQGTLFYLEQILEINLQDENPRANVSMSNQQDIKIYKGIDNFINFRIKNNERKPVLVIDKTLTAHIVNIEDNVLVMEKALVSDKCCFAAKLDLTAKELTNLPAGDYYFVITYEDLEHRSGVLYTDRATDAVGYFTIVEKSPPPPQESIVIDQFVDNINFQNIQTSYPVPGSAQKELVGSLHSFSVTTDANFKGTVTIQGSLEPIYADVDNSWFDLGHITFSPIPQPNQSVTTKEQSGKVEIVTTEKGVPAIGGMSSPRFHGYIREPNGLIIKPGSRLVLINDGNIFYVESSDIYMAGIEEDSGGRKIKYSFPNVFNGTFKNSTPLYYEVGAPLLTNTTSTKIGYGNFSANVFWVRVVVDYETNEIQNRNGYVKHVLIRN